MKNFIKEFKEFAIKGSVIDLAVGVIIGTAFGRITTSLVSDVVTPLLGLVAGKLDFKTFYIGPVAIGNFIDAAINFLLVASIIFIMVKGINLLRRRMQKEDAHKSPIVERPTKQEMLLEEIRDILQNRSRT